MQQEHKGGISGSGSVWASCLGKHHKEDIPELNQVGMGSVGALQRQEERNQDPECVWERMRRLLPLVNGL